MRGEILGLTMYDPWATLVAVGVKRIETRSWGTSYRGLLAIHASKAFAREDMELCSRRPFVQTLREAGVHRPGDMPRGAVVAVAWLVGCERIPSAPRLPGAAGFDLPKGPELCFGDYRVGRWVWRLQEVHRLHEAVPCKGARRLWPLPEEVLRAVQAQLERGDDE